MTTTFFIIRHGETRWNLEQRIQGHRDSPLSPLGCRQAEALAARLAGESFELIISSDLQRAWQTAQVDCRTQRAPTVAGS